MLLKMAYHITLDGPFSSQFHRYEALNRIWDENNVVWTSQINFQTSSDGMMRFPKMLEFLSILVILGSFKGVSPRWVPTRKKKYVFFFLIRTSRSFPQNFLKIFAKIRSSRDMSKNGVLGQIFDFRSPHTPPTLGVVHFLG